MPKHTCPPGRGSTLYTVLVVDESGENVLVRRFADGIGFPRLGSPEVPHFGQRMSECVASHLFELCATEYDLVLLYSTLNETYQDHLQLPHHAMFAVRGPCDEFGFPDMPVCEQYDWVPIALVRSGEEFLSEDDDKLALDTLLRDAANPWERPRWFSTTVGEAALTLQRLGLETKGGFVQHTVTDHSAILSIETSQQVVYLKCSNQIEARVVELAASFAPFLVRQPLHVCRERGWVMMPHYGSTLGEAMTATDFSRIASLYGAMQVCSLSFLRELETCGVVKCTVGSIMQRVESVLNERICTTTLGKIPVSDIKCLLVYLYEKSGAPLTLVHGDLWDENVLKAQNEQYAIIDWERAKLDLPFAEVMHMARGVAHFDRRAKDASTIEYGLNGYFEQWKRYGDVEKLKKISRGVQLKENLLRIVKAIEYRKRMQLDVLQQDIAHLRRNVREIGQYCRALGQAASD